MDDAPSSILSRTITADSNKCNVASTTKPTDIMKEDDVGICCFYMKYGKCEPPRPPCRFRHNIDGDDCVTPCCFGPTCRQGHKNRVVITNDTRDEYWKKFRGDGNAVVGDSPAARDATQLRSQLEPYPTAKLRERLATVFGEDHREMDDLARGPVMSKLLQHYTDRAHQRSNPIHPYFPCRDEILRVEGKAVRPELCKEILTELIAWRSRHTVNTRPSISAESYMILRSPIEFSSKLQHQASSNPEGDEVNCTDGDNAKNGDVGDGSRSAKAAAWKLKQYQTLWDLAYKAIKETDIEFAETFSALAVTYNFRGSPHIDKQNTGPFYGLSLGQFSIRKQEETNGETITNDKSDSSSSCCAGNLVVESLPTQVTSVDTHNKLGKVDGRYPHWVAPYDGERYSLIYYSTWRDYVPPGPAFLP